MKEDADVLMLDSFCNKHSLTWRLSDQYEPIALGENGYLFAYTDSRMGCAFYPSELSASVWQDYITTCLRSGMTVVADRLYESYLSFDPLDTVQSSLASKICGAQRGSQTEAERDHLKRAVRRIRKSRAAKELASQQRERDWRLRLLFG